MQFVHAISGSAIFCQVIFEWFQKAYEGNSAFMVDPVAHSERVLNEGANIRIFSGLD
jgi:hypothetical protein